MLSIKDYARSRHISYEAVRQSIKKHQAEISEHIHIQGRTRYLDDKAIEILDKFRNGNKIVSLDDAIHDEDKETIEALKDQIILLQQELIKAREVASIASEKALRLELMTESFHKQETQIEHLEAELRSYHPTIFGLYRKKTTSEI